jgi:chaperonin GroES
MNYECIGDRVLIKPVAKKETTLSGLMLPEHERKQEPMGEIVAVGTGVPLHNIVLKVEGWTMPETMKEVERVLQLIKEGRPMRVQVGDIVQYGAMAGTKVRIEGEEYVMIREADVFGRIPKNP